MKRDRDFVDLFGLLVLGCVAVLVVALTCLAFVSLCSEILKVAA